MTPELPRRFHLQRDTDVSGVSGTGRVADGVLWPDGTVSLRWIGARPSVVFWDRLEDAEAVHGHGGATRIVWDDRLTAAPAGVWVDGDPLMEAIAAAVWERCSRDDKDMPQLVLDDPRNIAAAAAAGARALVLRTAADALDESETLRDLTDDHMHDVNAAANELRRMADGARS
jgi:hypothetical protein